MDTSVEDYERAINVRRNPVVEIYTDDDSGARVCKISNHQTVTNDTFAFLLEDGNDQDYGLDDVDVLYLYNVYEWASDLFMGHGSLKQLIAETSEGHHLHIEEPINNCKELTHLDVECRMSLCHSAFSYNGFEEITLPSITTCDEEAFSHCFALHTVNFDDSQNITGNRMFYACPELTTVNAKNLKDIGYEAFAYCPLTNASWISDVTHIESYAFQENKFKEVIVNAHCERGAFERSSELRQVTINSYNIAERLFNECPRLEIVVATDNTKSVKEGAFMKCSQLHTFDGKGIERIGDGAFYGTKLSAIDFPECEEIDSGAFANCTELVSANLASIEEIGHGAFHGCIKFTNLRLSTEGEIDIRDNAFQSCGFDILDLKDVKIKTFSQNMFEMCNKLLYVTCPSTLTHLRAQSLKETALTTFETPENIQFIYSDVFAFSAVRSIRLNNRLYAMLMKEDAFAHAQNLKYVVFKHIPKVILSGQNAHTRVQVIVVEHAYPLPTDALNLDPHDAQQISFESWLHRLPNLKLLIIHPDQTLPNENVLKRKFRIERINRDPMLPLRVTPQNISQLLTIEPRLKNIRPNDANWIHTLAMVLRNATRRKFAIPQEIFDLIVDMAYWSYDHDRYFEHVRRRLPIVYPNEFRFLNVNADNNGPEYFDQL